MPPFFRRAAVLGTGLIGGSFALAVRRHEPEAVVAGWDKESVLRVAQEYGAIHEGFVDLSSAVAGADLIYIALPVGQTLEALPQVAAAAAPQALVTDAASTKRAVCAAAARCFSGAGARFLGGHPMAGKEVSGIAAAEAGLFAGANYALVRVDANRQGASGASERVAEFVKLLERMEAAPVWLDAETHDRAAAIVSHLPQLMAVALAQVVSAAADPSGLPLTVAGRGLRDALRLAGSPYSLWRDIILTNSDNLEQALDQLIGSLETIRGELRTRTLEHDFAAAGELYKLLNQLK